MAMPRATQPPGVLPSSDVRPSSRTIGVRYVAERIDEHRIRRIRSGYPPNVGVCGSCGTAVHLSPAAVGLPVVCWRCRIAEEA